MFPSNSIFDLPEDGLGDPVQGVLGVPVAVDVDLDGPVVEEAVEVDVDPVLEGSLLPLRAIGISSSLIPISIRSRGA